MDEASRLQNRRERRANVLMAAALELSGKSLPVKLRNLSADGALIEGDQLPIEGAEVLFRRQELGVPARIVWVRGGRAGLAFKEALPPETVLRHVPTPRPRVLPDCRRPGLTSRSLSVGEQKLAEQWLTRRSFDLPGE